MLREGIVHRRQGHASPPDCLLACCVLFLTGRKAQILDVEEDEAHIAVAKRVAKTLRSIQETLGVGAGDM